jgi:hypothetical protein
LAGVVEKGGMDIYAWALMPNHFHLLCKTKNWPLSSSMRRILTGYAVNFNKRHKRHGHLFQNRVVPTKQCGSIILISYISCLLAAHSEKPGVYKVKQGNIPKPALLCRDYRYSH